MNEIPVFRSIEHRLIPDDTRGVAGVEFELLRYGERQDHLRDREQPDDLYGFRWRLEHEGAWKLVGMARAAQMYPPTSIRRAGMFDRFNRRRTLSGDRLFDRRWFVESDDREFATALMSASMRAWLTSIEAEHLTPEFEIRHRWVIAVDPRRPLELLPSVVQKVHEFVSLIPPWSQ